MRALAVLLAALLVWVAVVPECGAQRRGGGFGGGYGGYRGGYGGGYKPPVFRQPQMRTPTMTPRTPSMSPKAARPMQPRAPSIRGPNPRGATQPIPGRVNPGVSKPVTKPPVKAPATVAKLPAFKGQYSNGKPILQSKGKNYRVPEKGVLSASRAKLLSGAGTTAITSRWSTVQKANVSGRIVALRQSTPFWLPSQKIGWLNHHEGGSHGGHTIAKHVARSDEWLKNRLTYEKGINSSSSYKDQQTAERVIRRAINKNRNEIRKWMKDSSSTRKMAICYDAGKVIGRGVQRTDSGQPGEATDHGGSMTILTKNPQGGYKILTSYTVKKC